MTPFSEIDNMFLSDIKDKTLLDFTEVERQQMLDIWRNKAITRFKACKKDLYDKVDTVYDVETGEDDEEIVTMTVGYFNQTLTDEEKLIIATIMKKYWLSDKIYSLELLKQRMATKEFRLTPQGELLLRLTVLNQEVDKEISRMIVDYTVYAFKVGEQND
jgi:uncharacterized protein YuzB (UPF0349 family)